MKKVIGLIVVLVFIIGIFIYFTVTNNNSNDESSEDVDFNTLENDNDLGDDENMRIRVSDGSREIIFELNDSSAARSLYEQLPLTLETENFNSNEKIFYPKKLDVSDTPLAKSGGRGVLAYYEPWGDVVMFYDSFSSNSSLYELGKASRGADEIENLSGEIKVERLED